MRLVAVEEKEEEQSKIKPYVNRRGKEEILENYYKAKKALNSNLKNTIV